MGWVRDWWAQPDHYRWLSGYLGYRNVRKFTGRMMATVVGLLGAVPLLTLWTPVGPQTVIPRALTILVTVYCGVMAVMWLRRWPSRRQSVLFVVTANACIAVTCVVYSSAGMSLIA